jgi:hypothetical protein
VLCRMVLKPVQWPEETLAQYSIIWSDERGIRKCCVRILCWWVEHLFHFSCRWHWYPRHCCVAAALGKIASNVTGLDGIPLVFIKLLLPLILPCLTELFNYILTFSTFPLVWKIAIVVPIPKVAMAFENVLYEQMVNYVGRNSLFSSFQSGLRPGQWSQHGNWYCKSLRWYSSQYGVESPNDSCFAWLFKSFWHCVIWIVYS